MNRYYVTVEGVDAVGKTSLAEHLRTLLEARGIRTAVKREFPNALDIRSPIEQALKQSIFVGQGFERGPVAAFFFMFYAETVALGETTRTTDVLIGDRGIDSLCLYQGGLVRRRAQFDAVRIVTAMEQVYLSLGLRIPDRTILLTLSQEQVVERCGKRLGRRLSRKELDRIAWLQEQYLKVAAARPRYLIIDANQSEDSVAKIGLQAVASLLQKVGANAESGQLDVVPLRSRGR
jgi:thymidylate kinase